MTDAAIYLGVLLCGGILGALLIMSLHERRDRRNAADRTISIDGQLYALFPINISAEASHDRLS